MHGAKVKI